MTKTTTFKVVRAATVLRAAWEQTRLTGGIGADTLEGGVGADTLDGRR